MTSPWAAPGIPKKAVQVALHAPPAAVHLADGRPEDVGLGHPDAAELQRASYRINKGRMVRISNYSRDAMTELLAEVPLAFDLREMGTLQLFRTEKQVKGSKADQEVLAEYGSPYEVLDRDGCIAVEPGLVHVADKFVGGLRLTADRTGDCRMFTLALAEKADGTRRLVPLRQHDQRLHPPGRPHHRRRDGARGGDRRRLRLRARALRADPAAHASASGCRSTRSRATRSPCRSPTTPPRRSRR